MPDWHKLSTYLELPRCSGVQPSAELRWGMRSEIFRICLSNLGHISCCPLQVQWTHWTLCCHLLKACQNFWKARYLWCAEKLFWFMAKILGFTIYKTSASNEDFLMSSWIRQCSNLNFPPLEYVSDFKCRPMTMKQGLSRPITALLHHCGRGGAVGYTQINQHNKWREL